MARFNRSHDDFNLRYNDGWDIGYSSDTGKRAAISIP
jgi:hypothetical protein